MLHARTSIDVCKAMSKEQYSTLSNQPSSHFSMGHPLASIQSNMLPLPVMPGFACTSLSTENTFQFRNQFLATNSEAQAVFSNDAQILHDLLQSDSGSLKHAISGYTHTTLRNETDTSMVGHGLPSGLETTMCSSRYPAMSQYLVPKENLFRHFGGEAGLTNSLTGLNGFCETISNAGNYLPGKRSLQNAGLDATYSSLGCPVIEDNLSGRISLSKGLTFAQEIPEMLLSKFSEVVNPGHDTTVPGPISTNLFQTNALAQQKKSSTASKSDSLPSDFSIPSCLSQGGDYSNVPSIQVSSRPVENIITPGTNILGITCDGKVNYSGDGQLLSDIDLFDGMDLDLRHMFQGEGLWDDMFMPVENGDHQKLNIDVSERTSEFDKDAMSGNENGLFSEFGLRRILDSIGDSKVDSSTSHSSVITSVKSANNQETENQFSASSNLENAPSSGKLQQAVVPGFVDTTNLLLTRHNIEKIMQESSEGQLTKYKGGSWIDDSYSMNAENHFNNQPKKPEESMKIQKKRARPGESTRPRPKDRQQIQDRVKELREIVPNGAKCSIDALLARTVNHMLFLQGVIKYADKIKQADEPKKMIGEDTGVILRDSPSNGGGATWAYEVAGQTIVCPITIKELNPPGQMLIEILCEDRGSFLEMADSIRGFGLTILKGVMEGRDKKIWAHFLVEANQDVTRMEIFLHLVQLLAKTSGVGSNDHTAQVMDSGIPVFSNYQHSQMPIPIGLADRGR